MLCLCDAHIVLWNFSLNFAHLFSLYFMYGLRYFRSLSKSAESTACWTQICSDPKAFMPQEGKTWTGLFTTFLRHIGMLRAYSSLLVTLRIKVFIISGTINIKQHKLILLKHFPRNLSSILANLFSYDGCFMKQDTRINSAGNKEKQLHTWATCTAWWSQLRWILFKSHCCSPRLLCFQIILNM